MKGILNFRVLKRYFGRWVVISNNILIEVVCNAVNYNKLRLNPSRVVSGGVYSRGEEASITHHRRNSLRKIVIVLKAFRGKFEFKFKSKPRRKFIKNEDERLSASYLFGSALVSLSRK